MDAKIIREYQKHRKEGIDARNALRWAKSSAKYAEIRDRDYDFQYDRDRQVARFTRGIFNVKVEIVDDDDGMDRSFVGEMTDQPPYGGYAEGVIDRYRRLYHERADDIRNNEYRYIVLETGYTEQVDSLRKMKIGKAEADRLAREYVERDIDLLESEQYNSYGVVVTLSIGEIEVLHNSLWGIDTDSDPSDEDYTIEVAEDLIADAIAESNERVKAIIAELEGQVSKLKEVAA
jgi:hypothetical protein